MARVLVEVLISAPPERVWQALTVPAEVTEWDGVVPLEVPPGYPQPGQHARWRMRVGPLPLVLHDRIRAVEQHRRLAATIDVGFVHIHEEYRLAPADGGTRLVADNEVRSRIPGFSWLARRLAGSNVAASMARLAALCEQAV